MKKNAPQQNSFPVPGLVSATTPDWSREKCRRFFDPSRRLLQSIRLYQRLGDVHFIARPFLHTIALLSYRFWSIVTGADIPLNSSKIAGGLLLPHPNGIVINPDTVIGPNCLIFQQVTLGIGGKIPGAPKIGGHVDIGAGAKILGGVTIGNNVLIGANAVVIDDVPENATAVGVPARIIQS